MMGAVEGKVGGREKKGKKKVGERRKAKKKSGRFGFGFLGGVSLYLIAISLDLFQICTHFFRKLIIVRTR